MKSACALIASSLLFAACTTAPAPQPAEPAATSPAASGPATKPYANLAQMMRAIPFPASNIIFAAQNEDPGKAKKAEGGADRYSNMYGGWEAVENASLALSETANLLLIPGRKCMNGKDAPLDREDYKKAIQQLADAGEAAYKAAQKKDLDAIVEVSGTVAEACSACHDVYREKDNPQDRCTPPAGK